MVKIGRFPRFGKRFFRRIRKQMGRGNFEHFWRLAMALASVSGRHNLSRLHQAGGGPCTRQALSYFLEHAAWEAPELLQQAAHDTLLRLGYRPGMALYLLLDDTQKRKRGRVMAAVSKLFLHAEKVYANGHTILGVCLLFRGVLIPYAVRLWANQEFCHQSQQERHPYDRVCFAKLTELAAAVIRDLTLPGNGQNVTVLFDSYYLCSTVLAACQVRNWSFVSVAKKNRNFRPAGRPRDKRKLKSYGAKLFERHGVWRTVNGKKHQLVERVGDLSKAGRVKLVFSRRSNEKQWVVLATNHLQWKVTEVLQHYLQRWPIEVLFKMSKQYLGLGDYQVLRYRGVVRYLHLVLIAYLLLTHLAFDMPDVQADLQGNDALRLPSIPQLQQHLRGLLWDDALARWENPDRP
jgi:hypothetical protein